MTDYKFYVPNGWRRGEELSFNKADCHTLLIVVRRPPPVLNPAKLLEIANHTHAVYFRDMAELQAFLAWWFE